MRPPARQYVPGQYCTARFPRPSKYVYPCLRLPRHHTDRMTFGALAHRDMTGAQTTQAADRPPCKRRQGRAVKGQG